MQMKSTMTYSELITCFRKSFAKNMATFSSGISLLMSALIKGGAGICVKTLSEMSFCHGVFTAMIDVIGGR